MTEPITDYRRITTRDGFIRLTGDKDGVIVARKPSQALRILAGREAARERAEEGTELSDAAIAAWHDWSEALGYEYQDDPMWAEFQARITEKLERGRIEYGDDSLRLPWEEVVDQAAEEPVDIAGWLALAIERFPDRGAAIAAVQRKAFALWKYMQEELYG